MEKSRPGRSSSRFRERVLWQKFECLRLARAGDPEVAVIERCDFDHIEPLCDGHQARIRPTQREVRVLVDQLGDPLAVVRRQRLEVDVAACHRAIEGRFGRASKLPLDQVCRLGQDESCGDEIFDRGIKQIYAGLVVGVTLVGRRDEDAGVGDQHDSGLAEAFGKQVVGLAGGTAARRCSKAHEAPSTTLSGKSRRELIEQLVGLIPSRVASAFSRSTSSPTVIAITSAYAAPAPLEAHSKFLALVTGRGLEPVDLVAQDWERVAALCQQYADLRLDAIAPPPTLVIRFLERCCYVSGSSGRFNT